MEFVDKLSGYAEQIRLWLSSILDHISARFDLGIAGLAAEFPRYQHYLPQVFEASIVVLAFAVLFIAGRIRRDRRAIRGMLAELSIHRAEFSELRAFQESMEERIARVLSDTFELSARQRSVEARVGKPDPQLAAAMARAGTGRQQMVECGLSHGEVHLLRALSAAETRVGDERV